MRGNPVMKAKRVTGPTPNTELCIRILGERCKCGNPVLISTSVNGTIVRKCRTCVGLDSAQVGSRNVPAHIAAEMWWMRK